MHSKSKPYTQSLIRYNVQHIYHLKKTTENVNRWPESVNSIQSSEGHECAKCAHMSSPTWNAFQKADMVLLDSRHTISWAPSFVLSVINTPPEFDLQIYWSNQIWHAISKALFTEDILMQIKPKWGNVKYPSFKITHCADFPPPPRA